MRNGGNQVSRGITHLWPLGAFQVTRQSSWLRLKVRGGRQGVLVNTWSYAHHGKPCLPYSLTPTVCRWDPLQAYKILHLAFEHLPQVIQEAATFISARGMIKEFPWGVGRRVWVRGRKSLGASSSWRRQHLSRILRNTLSNYLPLPSSLSSRMPTSIRPVTH